MKRRRQWLQRRRPGLLQAPWQIEDDFVPQPLRLSNAAAAALETINETVRTATTPPGRGSQPDLTGSGQALAALLLLRELRDQPGTRDHPPVAPGPVAISPGSRTPSPTTTSSSSPRSPKPISI
ncbi:hypothetical protein AB0L49_28240 [Streptomyces antimycoticus]|uniref:hypothetical protein n=1 Tax=Streptomyces antimycoticus TaxID=68175 RepID=UPI00343C0E69